MTGRTVLIGLDGATFTILDPLMQRGVLPFLQRFAASGVRATLHSVIPPLTPPAWTSLVTGRSPGLHGVFDFFLRDSADSQHIRFATSQDVDAETIWSVADRHGLRTTVLNFPLMFPPPQISGYVVPGWMPWRQLRLGCHPPNLYDRLKALSGFNARELAMDMELEEKAIEGCQPDEYVEWIEFYTRREQQWLRVLRALMLEEPCQLTAVLFDGMDKLQHLCWRFLEPARPDESMSPKARTIRQLVLEYYRQLDRALCEIVSLAGPDATVVLASDHGFGPQNTTFFINTWLQQHGYLAWADGQAPLASDTKSVGIGQLARHIHLLDWERTTAYVPTPSGNGIHIVVAGQGSEHGVAPAEYERFRSQLAQELRDFTAPASGERVVSEIWFREDAFAGPSMELAPDLTVLLADGGQVSILASDEPFKLRPEVRGAHRLEGVFIADGPALRTGEQLAPLSILDMAPLLLHSLGLPIPDDMEGRVPTEALEPAALLAQPVRTVSQPGAAATPPQTWSGPVMDEEDEAEMLRRLRALGYVQ